MRLVLVAILIVLAVCLPSCKRSSSPAPTGAAGIRIGNNGWGTCFGWKGNEILYVIFLREAKGTPAGPERSRRSTTSGDVVTSYNFVVLDGQDFDVKFTSATPGVIDIAGVKHSLSEGRVFLCRVENRALIVKQVDVPIQPNSDYQQEMKRLATEPPVHEFLSVTASQPAG